MGEERIYPFSKNLDLDYSKPPEKSHIFKEVYPVEKYLADGESSEKGESFLIEINLDEFDRLVQENEDLIVAFVQSIYRMKRWECIIGLI